MTRIPLTDEDIETFSSDEELLDGVEILVSIHTNNDDAPQLKKQILDDSRIVQKVREEYKIADEDATRAGNDPGLNTLAITLERILKE